MKSLRDLHDKVFDHAILLRRITTDNHWFRGDRHATQHRRCRALTAPSSGAVQRGASGASRPRPPRRASGPSLPWAARGRVTTPGILLRGFLGRARGRVSVVSEQSVSIDCSVCVLLAGGFDLVVKNSLCSDATGRPRGGPRARGGPKRNPQGTPRRAPPVGGSHRGAPGGPYGRLPNVFPRCHLGGLSPTRDPWGTRAGTPPRGPPGHP